MDPTDETGRRIVVVAMTLAAGRGWRRTGLAEVARAAGVPLAELYRRFPTRAHLLAGLSRLADAAVLAAEPADLNSETEDEPEDEPPRDRLFDVMMRRFDALLPYREGLASVTRDLRREPLTALAFAPHVARSMAWMLRAARIDPDAPDGPALVAGLVAVHARVMRTFLADDTADLARTMAALDAELRRAESWWAALRRHGSRRPPRAEPVDAPAG